MCFARSFPAKQSPPPPSCRRRSRCRRADTPAGDRVTLLHRARRRPAAAATASAPRSRRGTAGYAPDRRQPLSSVDSTLHRLLLIELLVTVAVLAGLAALGLWVIRIGLRPLAGSGQTAATIAAGDLSQRVEPARSQTEVGRLGRALNAMLDQIEALRTERSCAASSPTPRTSCGRRSPPYAPTPSCSGAAPPRGRRISSGRWRGSPGSPSGCASSSTTCSCSRGSTRAGRSRRSRSTWPRSSARRSRRGTCRRAGSPDRALRRAGDRDRRRGTAPADARQPARERPDAHAGRHARLGRARARRRPRGPDRHRPRARD